MFTFSVDGSIDSTSVAFSASFSDAFPRPLTETVLSIDPPHTDQPPARRPLRILILGDERDVVATIGVLQQRGFAQRDEWSRPMPLNRSVEAIVNILASLPERSVMGLLTRYFIN